MTTEGIVIPKDKIVVLEHAPTLDVVKKKSRNRRSLNDSTNMKWVNSYILQSEYSFCFISIMNFDLCICFFDALMN